ncbi:PIN domain-containing protein [Acidianus ambivalens]|uniref:Ribonuclease VapC n=1 Tax=Acidianus ambivalens TaxID=2283 RepID=A0A650CTD5_ACIAM|nr:PIN domain-containing protein [Acidianus ambivalens]MQL56481.1 PIN domain-containing protein [Acidianus ambivalens]QGR21114.1 PIN domain-containing protein [Acidianus ambivalens]
MIVVDTNILVYSTFEDSENHSEALEIIEKEDVKIPQIVVYEFLWVLAKLASDVSLIKTKIEELREFEIIYENPETILNGVKMLKEDGKPLKMLNDYVILALAKELKGDLATYDEKLRKIAEKHGVRTIP